MLGCPVCYSLKGTVCMTQPKSQILSNEPDSNLPNLSEVDQFNDILKARISRSSQLDFPPERCLGLPKVVRVPSRLICCPCGQTRSNDHQNNGNNLGLGSPNLQIIQPENQRQGQPVSSLKIFHLDLF